MSALNVHLCRLVEVGGVSALPVDANRGATFHSAAQRYSAVPQCAAIASDARGQW